MPELLAFAALISGLGAPCSSLGDRSRVAIRQAAHVRFAVGLTTEQRRTDFGMAGRHATALAKARDGCAALARWKRLPRRLISR